jgi:NAD(P)-dependent dehydrogenase (short-subunit alcohol dehydrogenase family)
MASGLAQAGARVAVLGRREEPTLAVAATIRAAEGEAIGVAADSAGLGSSFSSQWYS